MFAGWRMAAVYIAVMLFIGAALLWVRSYFYYDAIEYGFKQDSVACVSYYGVVGFYFQTNQPRQWVKPPGLFWSHAPRSRLGPGPRGVLNSMFGFRWSNQVFTFPAGPGFPGTTMHIRIVSVPMWTLLALCAPWPVYVFFHGRRKVRWGLRKDVRWINFRLRRRLIRFVIFSAAGAATGALAAWLDLEFRLWRAQWLWMLALFMLLLAVGYAVVMGCRRIPWYRALLWMSLEIGGCVSFYAATIQWAWRVYGGYRIYEPVMTTESLIIGFACFVCGAILLLFFQVRPEPVKPGPYCPQCGYCLIGSPRQICPECGRAFTLEELGIGPEALLPPGAGFKPG
jgi:hypothetical protein